MNVTRDNNSGNQVTLYTKLINALTLIYVDLRKNILLLLVCILIPTVLLVIYNYSKSKVYTTSFTVVYEELVRKIYGDRLEKLNFIVQNNPEKLSGVLGISDKAAETIIEVQGTNILGEDLTNDLGVEAIPFIVQINIKDTLHVDEIQNSIVAFLETGNSYLSDKKQIKLKEIEDELVYVEKQLSLLDTLKNKLNKSDISRSEGSNTTDYSSIYQVSYELYKKKQELLKKKEMPMNLYVIDDALAPMPANHSYIVIIGAGVVLGFIAYLFLTYLVLPVVRYRK